MRKLLGLIGLGAALTYFFHPEQGAGRRAQVRHRIKGLLGSTEERPDDVTLARQVESELFRDEQVPKGQINVNAENGKVYLRGEVGDVVTGVVQLALLPVDVGDAGLGGDHALEPLAPAVRHRAVPPVVSRTGSLP